MIALILLIQDGVVSEQDLKAAFLFNFARHVEWPADAFASDTAPFVLGIAADDPMVRAAEAMFKGKSVHGRPVELRRSKNGEGLAGAHLVFVGAGADAASILRNSRAMTVGEAPGFLRAGGVVNFFVEERRLRFEIGLAAAERAGLRVSSKLLRIARVARGDE